MSDNASTGVVSEVEVLTPEPAANGRPKVNRQIYANSALKGSEVEALLAQLPSGLHDAKEPNLAILHEKPEHRIILLLKLKALSNREIARATGYTEAWISQVCRQPWFQARLVTELQTAQTEVIDDLVRVEATNSFFKLVNLRDTAKSEQVQFAAAVRLFEQQAGKPVQRTEVSGKVTHQLTKADEIDEELRRLEEEERKLLSDHAHGKS